MINTQEITLNFPTDFSENDYGFIFSKVTEHGSHVIQAILIAEIAKLLELLEINKDVEDNESQIDHCIKLYFSLVVSERRKEHADIQRRLENYIAKKK